MSDVLTIAEIHTQFPSEWVLLEDPQTDQALRVQGGKLLWHSNDRDEVERKALELKPKYSTIVYTGTIPKGTAVIL
ncbi:MAG TPA: hypothetical protein VFE78_34920 [Gemmataceae bacterium]|jgi:hypothetical protein|nr:hypothetical protein [Gemmataceae bacterium]